LTEAIRRTFTESDRTYGARRVRAALAHAGIACGRERVQRLMRENHLIARRPRPGEPPATDAPAPSPTAPNLLDRQFTAPAANSKWVADFTALSTGEGVLYVAAVLDLYSRRVVGWAMHSTMTAQLVTDALLMALWRRGPVKALLHHSDRGGQYASEPFQRLLSAHGITCSMSRNGDCWDNAVMESFFSTLKSERTHRKHYRTRDEARADVFDYIERFYNPTRRHSTLGYLSPIDYEKAHSAEGQDAPEPPV
jgi:putative transposase